MHETGKGSIDVSYLRFIASARTVKFKRTMMLNELANANSVKHQLINASLCMFSLLVMKICIRETIGLIFSLNMFALTGFPHAKL